MRHLCDICREYEAVTTSAAPGDKAGYAVCSEACLHEAYTRPVPDPETDMAAFWKRTYEYEKQMCDDFEHSAKSLSATLDLARQRTELILDGLLRMEKEGAHTWDMIPLVRQVWRGLGGGVPKEETADEIKERERKTEACKVQH